MSKMNSGSALVLPLRFNLTFIALLIVAAFLGSACSSVTLAKDRDAVYKQAVEASLEGEHALAGAAANRYISGSTTDDPRYDRALRILAESAEKLGFTYAASLWYLEIAESRRDVDVTDEAIRGLERIVATKAYDEGTILQGFLGSDDISGLPPEQQAFVKYHQGVNSLKNGFKEWGLLQFEKIPDGSPYQFRAQYVLAVDKLSHYELTSAREDLELILAQDETRKLPLDLRQDVQRTLARIAFEQARYPEAIVLYQELRETAPDDPALLLEMAWSHYYSREYERALGLLIALDAPSYRELIAPERFLLEALALRHICQFEPARNAAFRLRSTYGQAISELYDGVPLRKSQPLREAARVRTSDAPIGRFRARVILEHAKIEDMEDDIGPEFAKRLNELYSQGLKESKRREDEELVFEMRRVAQELLEAEEGVRLILHELGVALLRGRRRPAGLGDRLRIDETFGPEHILYQFQGEFWTDELDDLVVTMEDRCIE